MTDQTKHARKIGMTFNMPQDWHMEFKKAAVTNGMNMNVLLKEAFEAWKIVEGWRTEVHKIERNWLLERKLKR